MPRPHVTRLLSNVDRPNPQFANQRATLNIIVQKNTMATACILGLIYFGMVFALAFAMGVARVLLIAPKLGAATAVLLEVPIIVAASWVIARRLLHHRSLSLSQRAAMGMVAFTLTMVSEVVLSALMRGQSVADWGADVVTPLGLIGLAGQAAFAVIPVLVGLGRDDVPPQA